MPITMGSNNKNGKISSSNSNSVLKYTHTHTHNCFAAGSQKAGGPKLWRSTCGRFMVGGEGYGCGVVPLPHGWSLRTREGAISFPGKKCKLHTENVKFGAHFCVLQLFQNHCGFKFQNFREILFMLPEAGD